MQISLLSPELLRDPKSWSGLRPPAELPVAQLNQSVGGCLRDTKSRLQSSRNQAPVVQTMDSAVHRINHYPADNSIGFASVYPLDSDLSGGQCYPSFEYLGPDGQSDTVSRHSG